MLNLNQITLAGNLGADLEVKTLDGGRQVGRFRLAVNTQWKDAEGERQGRTDWFTCVLWKPTDGARKYLTKGTNVWLQGEVKVRTTDEATYFDVVVRQWRVVSFKDDEASGDVAEEEPAAGAVDQEFAAIFDEAPAPEAKARGRKAK